MQPLWRWGGERVGFGGTKQKRVCVYGGGVKGYKINPKRGERGEDHGCSEAGEQGMKLCLRPIKELEPARPEWDGRKESPPMSGCSTLA